MHLSLSDPKGDVVLGNPAAVVLTIQDDAWDVIEGDVDGSGNVDLNDLKMTLQVISGETLGSDVYKGGDINGDGKIGSEEAIYMLKKIAEE